MIETAPLPKDCPSITFAHRHRAIVVSSQYPLLRLFHLKVNHRGSLIGISGWISEGQHDAAEKVHGLCYQQEVLLYLLCAPYC